MVEITIKKVKMSTIKLNKDNPRRISEKDMERLVKSLQDFPDMLKLREIVVDEKMSILGGNMRYLALKKLGMDECIAKIVKGLTPEQKREFVIRDNTTHGEWDFDLLGNDWDDLPLIDWGIEIPKHWQAEPKEPKEKKTKVEKPNIIMCPKCQHEFSVLKEK